MQRCARTTLLSVLASQVRHSSQHNNSVTTRRLSHCAPTKIPVVSVAGLRVLDQTNDGNRQRIGEELVANASDVGFFYVVDHGVSEEILREAREISRAFFGLPDSSKRNLSIRDEPSRRGYQIVGENITQGEADQHEAFDVYRDMPAVCETPMHPTNFGVNKWPTELPEMKRFFERRYVPAMYDLGGVVMRGIALGLGLPERHFEPYFTESFWIMRLIRYPPVPQSEIASDRMGCGTHTDYGFLTILNQDLDENHNLCLEAQMRDGSWVAVPPQQGALAVNIGDMLALWTGGRLRATPHRVKSPHTTDRVSVPFFFEPNYNALIEPLDLAHLGDTGQEVEEFKPIRYGDHLLSKISSNFDL